MKNKTIIITGAASGIGRATALLAAEKGANVVISDYNLEGCEETLSLIKKAGGEANIIGCDVSKLDDVKLLFAKAKDHYGQINATVNNAGIGGALEYFHKYDDDLYHQIIAINQTGVYYCMKEAIKMFLSQKVGGTIVNTSSLAGIGAAPRMGPYAASKHAVIGMTKAAASEYGKYNIRVNAVCPTVIETPMGAGYINDEANQASMEMIKGSIPMKRFGQASEVAEAIIWLSSESSSFINGQEMRVDGGMRA
jgi:NAD(P)-dependent dehydrogenase (short-subunit alcohol dehydrogenase family)